MRILLYLKLLASFLKFSLMSLAEYRINGVVTILETIFSFLISLAFFNIVFMKTSSVGLWSRNQIVLFYGVFLLTSNIFVFLFSNSLNKLQDYIEEGSFDRLLVRPVNALFLLSFNTINIFSLFDVIFSVLVIRYSLVNLNISLTFISLTGFLALLFSGLVIYYSIYLMLVTTAFWTIRTPYYELLDNLTGVAKYPLDIFGDRWIKFFTYLLPIIFIVTVPTKFLLGFNDNFQLAAPLVAFIAFYCAVKLWNFAIKSYTGASS